MKLQSPVFSYAILVALFFAALVYARWPWIEVDFLVSDDNIYFSKAVFGDFTSRSSRWVNWLLFNSLVQELNDVFWARLSFLLIFAACLAVLSKALPSAIQTGSIAVGFVFVAALMPISLRQGMFLNGSHPMLGVSCILIYSACIIRLCGSPGLLRTVALAAVALLFSVFSLYSSPVTQLSSLAALVFLAYPIQTGLKALKRTLIVLVAVGPLVAKKIHLTITGGSYNHYFDKVGWLDFSATNVVTQLIDSIVFLSDFGTIPTAILLTVLLAFLIGLGTLVYRAVASPHEQRTRAITALVLSFYLIATAGLLFGPASVLTTVRDRYLFGPTFFIIVSAGVLAAASVAGYRYQYRAAIVLVCALSVGAVVATRSYASDMFSKPLQQFTQIRTLVEDGKHSWPRRSQVMIIGDYKLTSGFNHWSTWFLRYLSSRQDIIGVIGRSSWLSNDPVISAYADHSDEFWELKKTASGTRSRRKKMIGLEEGRPTYVYWLDSPSPPRSIRYLMLVDQTTIRVLEATPTGLQSILEARKTEDALVDALDDFAGETAVFRLEGFEVGLSSELAKTLQRHRY